MVWWVVVTEIRSRRETSLVLPTVVCVSVVAVTGTHSRRVVSPALPTMNDTPIVMVVVILGGLGTLALTVNTRRLALTVRVSGWLGFRSWSWLASSSTCDVSVVSLSHIWMALGRVLVSVSVS